MGVHSSCPRISKEVFKQEELLPHLASKEQEKACKLSLMLLEKATNTLFD